MVRQSQAQIRETLFSQGVRAATAAGLERRYYCPICCNSFGEEALTVDQSGSVLTVEHVPPRSAGGRAIILTCKECNNFAGHKYEKDLKQSAKLSKQAMGMVGKVSGDIGHVIVEIDGTRLNANLTRSGDGVRLAISEHNIPQNIQVSKEKLESFTAGSKLTLHSTASFKADNIKLAELKALYLLMVAKFGYCVGFHPYLNPVRDALARGSGAQSMVRYFRGEIDLRGGVLVDFEAGIFAALVGERLCCCQWPSKLCSGFENEACQITLAGKVFEAPRSFEAILDK